MPDSHIPPRWRMLLRLTRASFYLALLAAGLADVFITPDSAFGSLRGPLALWWALLLAAGALLAIVGVLLNRYRIEWIATWPLIGGVMIYGASVWVALTGGESARATQATLTAALLLILVARSTELAGTASRMRSEFIQNTTGSITVVRGPGHG